MGLIWVLTRLTDADLYKIYSMDRSSDIADFVSSLAQADPSVTVSLDKSFVALELMFDRAGLPVNPVSGQGSIPSGDDFGEGIPNYMSPDYVVAVRDVLTHLTFDTLLENTGKNELSELRVRPFGPAWDDGHLDYLRSNFVTLVRFVGIAAERNCHIVAQLC